MSIAATVAPAGQKSRGRVLPPLWVQVTDFDVHALWIHAHVDRYCVASEEVAEDGAQARRDLVHARIVQRDVRG